MNTLKIEDLARNRELDRGQLQTLRGGADGISRLVAVTTLKTDNANDDALHGADKQKDSRVRSSPISYKIGYRML